FQRKLWTVFFPKTAPEPPVEVRPVKEKELEKFLYTSTLPPVDLLIRTAGEQRLSNFLLWQSAYAELYFTDTLWPDFDKTSLVDSLKWYETRTRKFGGLTNG
ncbi:undecaprenyl diphosphate synthase family protein, partial [Leptospira barantonii]|uniref:undecaprenyl diphosphate synthase family protein n=1 Tax=Leptospira barantonii TaxID=2023184 RepID=UPI001FEF4402